VAAEVDLEPAAIGAELGARVEDIGAGGAEPAVPRGAVIGVAVLGGVAAQRSTNTSSSGNRVPA